MCEVIASRAEKLKEMISSLFSLAKASSGNIELHEEPLSFHTLLTQILADMKDRIDAADLEFVLCFDAAGQLMTRWLSVSRCQV